MSWIVQTFQQVDSTMNLAAQAYEAQGAQKTVFLAQTQTQGRGRQERPWVSPQGNFYGSFLIPIQATLDQIPLYSFAMGLALWEVVQSYGVHAGLKWPNDLLVRGHKLGGLLLERIGEDGLILGVGVNLAVAPSLSSPLYKATCLADHVRDVPTPLAFLEKLIPLFDRWCTELHTGQSFINTWKERCAHMNQQIEIQTPQGPRTGICIDLTPQGALILQDPQTGQHQVIYAGDVAL
jgi:BirA family biotin operon repressor/biotin-[acetyl-CoA-carboxylase] ligase